MVYIVLGMHKSGTTLVSQILHHSGINMVDDVDTTISYIQGNKYERATTNRLNEEILNCLGTESLDIRPPASLQLTAAQQNQMTEIIQYCQGKYGDAWGFKDPRTTLTYPLWAKALPVHKLILIYRDPEELWQHYRARQRLRDRFLRPDLAPRLMQRWCEHNMQIISILQNTTVEYLILEYQDLMLKSEEFDRLQAFTGLALDDRRRLDLYHHRAAKKPVSLQIASWLIERKSGYRPDSIARHLNRLHDGQKHDGP